MFDSSMTPNIMLLGAPGVGKTSLISCATRANSKEQRDKAVGLDFYTIMPSRKKLEEAETPDLIVWDIAGSERHGCMTHVYYSFSYGALICWDLHRDDTFQVALDCYADYIKKTTNNDGNSTPLSTAAPISFVATQFDLNPSGHNINDLINSDAFQKQANRLLKEVQKINHRSKLKIYITSSNNNEAYYVIIYQTGDTLKFETSMRMTIPDMIADYTYFALASQKARRTGFSLFSYMPTQSGLCKRLWPESNRSSGAKTFVTWFWSSVNSNSAQQQATIGAVNQANVGVEQPPCMGRIHE